MDTKRNDRIKILRKHLSLTQEGMAKHLDVSKSYISDIENYRRPVTDRLIKSINTSFKMNSEWMYTGYGEIISNSTTKSVHQSVPHDVHSPNFIGAEDLRLFAEILMDGFESRKPTRYAKRLSENDVQFEYELGFHNYKDAFEDYENLIKAMLKMGPPNFMIDKFPSFDGTFIDYFTEKIEDHQDYFGDDYKINYKNKEHRLYIVEKIFHPGTEHLRILLSKLIKYLYQYGDMFTGGSWENEVSKLQK